MNQSESNLNILEQKLCHLVEAFRNIKKEKLSLNEEIDLLKDKLKASRSEVIKLKDENDRLKIASAMMGEDEHQRLMKLRVNKLIKELDNCIAQIKNENQ